MEQLFRTCSRFVEDSKGSQMSKQPHNRRLTKSRKVTRTDIKTDQIKMLRQMLNTKLSPEARANVKKKLAQLSV